MRPAKERSASRGFTVLELIVAVTMALILLAMASLNASNFLGHYRLRSAARQVATDLRLARTKAISQSERYRVRFSAGSVSYAVQHWNRVTNAWEPHALYSKQITTAGAAPLELAHPVRPVSSVDVEFEARGNTTGTPSVVLRDPGLGSVTKTVEVSLAGHVSIDD